MNDPKLDEMVKGAINSQQNIFQIVILYNPENNSSKVSYPVGPNGQMFWGAIWAALKEAQLTFERIRMLEMDKTSKQEKKSDLVIAKPGLIKS